MRVAGFRAGQRVAYTVHRWSGERFETVRRAATVVSGRGRHVAGRGLEISVITDFDRCRVWFPAAQLSTPEATS